MNPQEAKEILLMYRPGLGDDQDPEVAEALGLTRKDPELGRWFEEHRTFQAAMRDRFRQVRVPSALKDQILARHEAALVRVWWRNPLWQVAAVLALLIGLAGVWLKPRTPDRFSDYQARMVRSALREYRMDLVTNSMPQVRQFLAAKGAPADYVLPKGLERLQLTGGGLLRWRSQPVAMVCFDRGDRQMLFLFVMNQSAVRDSPPETPQVAKVNKLLTARWTRGGKTYLLAGPEEADFLQKYL